MLQEVERNTQGPGVLSELEKSSSREGQSGGQGCIAGRGELCGQGVQEGDMGWKTGMSFLGSGQQDQLLPTGRLRRHTLILSVQAANSFQWRGYL